MRTSITTPHSDKHETPKDQTSTLVDFFMDSYKTTEQIDLNLEEEHTYELDKLIEIYNKYATDNKQKYLAQKVFNVAKKCGFKVKFLVKDLGFNRGGQQDYDTIKIAKITTLEQNKEKLPNILLHEVIHGVTTYAINAYNNNDLSDNNLITAVEELNFIHSFILKYSNLNNEYGTHNKKEIIAELANPSFRKKLSEISITYNPELLQNTSFYDKEKNITAEDILISILYKFLDNYDDNLRKKYNKNDAIINEEEWKF